MSRNHSAAQIIAALEKGYCVATGSPQHIEYLRLEEYSNGAKKLESYGWGSAHGVPSSRLESILYRPYQWVIIHVKEYDRVRFERIAKRLLKARGGVGANGEWFWYYEER